MKGPQTWQKSLITWKYYGKTPLEKKIGAVSFTGGWAILFKKKKWTVPLILQFNISLLLKSQSLNFSFSLSQFILSASVQSSQSKEEDKNEYIRAMSICNWRVRSLDLLLLHHPALQDLSHHLLHLALHFHLHLLQHIPPGPVQHGQSSPPEAGVFC